jgi:hypothetical protein
MKTTSTSKKPRCTRAHYNFLASFIDEYAQEYELSNLQWIMLAGNLKDALVGTNPNFDTEKFYCAATKSMDRSGNGGCQ